MNRPPVRFAPNVGPEIKVKLLPGAEMPPAGSNVLIRLPEPAALPEQVQQAEPVQRAAAAKRAYNGKIWPFVCCQCNARYAHFVVYCKPGGKSGKWEKYLDYAVCMVCCDCRPGHTVLPRCAPVHCADSYHTILRPVPPDFNPKTNPWVVSDPKSTEIESE